MAIHRKKKNRKTPFQSHRSRRERNIAFWGIFWSSNRVEPTTSVPEHEPHSKIFMFGKFALRGRKLIGFDFLNKVFRSMRCASVVLLLVWRWGKIEPSFGCLRTICSVAKWDERVYTLYMYISGADQQAHIVQYIESDKLFPHSFQKLFSNL